MHLKIIDIDNYAKDMPEITTSKILEGGKLSKGGLFSQQIFGPIKSYRCACPRAIYRGQHSNETKCLECDVDITSSEERRKRFAKIVLPFEVMNPLFYFLVLNAKPSAKKTLDNLIFFKSKYFINEKNEMVKISELDDLSKNVQILQGLSGAIEYVKLLCKAFPNPEFKFIENNFSLSISNFLHNNLLCRLCGDAREE